MVGRKVPDQVSKGLNSIVILVAWSLWNHRNRCVSYGVQPNLSRLLSTIWDEQHVWELTGARGIAHRLGMGLQVSMRIFIGFRVSGDRVCQVSRENLKSPLRSRG
jgi:hypothetical protein